jgi:hypothetical protein
VAADEYLGPVDRARVRLASRSPRASRALTRFIMRGADKSFSAQ